MLRIHKFVAVVLLDKSTRWRCIDRSVSSFNTELYTTSQESRYLERQVDATRPSRFLLGRHSSYLPTARPSVWWKGIWLEQRRGHCLVCHLWCICDRFHCSPDMARRRQHNPPSYHLAAQHLVRYHRQYRHWLGPHSSRFLLANLVPSRPGQDTAELWAISDTTTSECSIRSHWQWYFCECCRLLRTTSDTRCCYRYCGHRIDLDMDSRRWKREVDRLPGI
jgi:hypothetical protein